jgi:glyoxylase-like metal-dependent hydrolase (beta-lactamase superfamily II)
MSPKLKRVLKISGIAIAAVVLFVVGAIAVLLGPFFVTRQSIVDGFEVEGIRILQNGIVSFAVVPVGPGEVALIDGGTDTSGQAILTELSRRNLTTDAVKAILVTHGHGDHLGAIKVFPRAEVMALETERGLIEGGGQGPAGIKVTSPLHDDETITVGNTQIRVFAIPGHSQGHAAYVVNGVLFLGDAAYAGKDGSLNNAVWIFSDSQDQNRTSLAKLYERLVQEKIDIKAIACAHSAVLTNGIMALAAFAQVR